MIVFFSPTGEILTFLYFDRPLKKHRFFFSIFFLYSLKRYSLSLLLFGPDGDIHSPIFSKREILTAFDHITIRKSTIRLALTRRAAVRPACLEVHP